MSVIALIGQKGGTSKTTIAINIAAELLRRGSRVLLVDADPQGTARTWAEVAAQGGHAAPTTVAMGATMHRPDQLPKLSSSHDVTVIDCPPRHGDVQRSALMVADIALLPCCPGYADAWALARTIELIDEARTVHPALQVAIVLTRLQSRTAISRTIRAALAETGLPILQASLGQRIAFTEFLGSGEGVTSYAPRDAAAGEIHALVDELLVFSKGENTHVQEASAGHSAQASG